MNDELNRYIDQAVDELGCARNLLADGMFRGAVGHCYYTCLWLVRGLLASKDLFSKTHTGADSLFNEHFVKPGLIPTGYKLTLRELFNQRQNADYDLDSQFTEKDVVRFIEKAEAFLAFVKSTFA